MVMPNLLVMKLLKCNPINKAALQVAREQMTESGNAINRKL